ncbi:hypothetical protein [Methylobacterium sp. J-070]|uniref:hypothetical protein n=1 Tax=Methylobacterium sp. J-070 TaxID=2836650 RepID=UPI001FBB260B|nr:hypothetical protein [Methylobacterium sp. J-070]MCJ2049835.1 hypothetical protein [Methylobacterium sp. J-070]
MPTQTFSALYDRYVDAAAAVTKLEAAGVPHSDISLVGNKTETTTGTGDTADHVATGAGTGATLGTILGGGAGLLAGLGLMAIPGVGPVVAAGWLVATLTGAGIGAAAGGLTGSLTSAGVSETDAHAYAEGVRRGGSLLTVRADEAHAAAAARILEEHGAVDLDARAQGWESEGWSGKPAGEARGDTLTLIGSDAAAGSTMRENDAVSTDTPMSGARRVRVYNHPV